MTKASKLLCKKIAKLEKKINDCAEGNTKSAVLIKH